MKQASINHRTAAALCDVLVVVAAWCVLVWPLCSPHMAQSALAWPHVGAVLVVAAVLCCFGLEMVTGLTLGKWVAGLRVRRLDETPATRQSLAIRGAIKLLLAALCFFPLFAVDEDVREALGWLAGAPLLVVLATTYIGLVRFNRSAFDLAAGTVVLAPEPASTSRS